MSRELIHAVAGISAYDGRGVGNTEAMADHQHGSSTPFEGLGSHFMLSDNEGSAHLVMAEYEAIAERIARDGATHVLDWGCGFGYVAKFLRERGVAVTLFDFDPNAAGTKQTRLKAFPDVEVTVSDDAVRLPYPDGHFDAVLSLGTLEHVQYPEQSVQEIRRVLASDGRFYLYKPPNRYSWVEFAARKSGKYYHGAHEHDRVYTFHSISQMLGKAGFDLGYAAHRNWFPLHRLSSIVDERYADRFRRMSDLITSTPGLRALSTNIELIATKRPDSVT